MEKILDTLFENHFVANKSSEVTSSHWRQNGDHKVSNDRRNFKLKGFGFGQFTHKSFLKSIKYFVVERACENLLKEYQCLPEIEQALRKLIKKQNRVFTYDCLNMALCFDYTAKALIKEKGVNSLTELEPHIKSALMIGDGYGTFGTLVKLTMPWIKITYVNLGRTLFFDAYYTEMAIPGSSSQLVATNEKPNASSEFTYIEAENYDLISQMSFDMIFNTFSMQEMNNSVIDNYFKYLRQAEGEKYFYCLNRTEKALPDGEVTRFDHYPWKEEDQTICHEVCPWAQEFPYHLPPFKKSFVGEVKHALKKLSK